MSLPSAAGNARNAMAGPPTLDDNAASSNAQVVRFLLAELGLALARREVAASRPRPGW